MATNVHLTPALEKFARKCVKSGRYNNVSEVVRAGLRMLEDADERRRKFNAMLDDAVREADEKGTFKIAEVITKAEKIIAKNRS
jgi:antitoxin ParD1/3/4